MMSNVAEGFDVWLAQWHGDVLRLCLALSLNRRAARELTFQAFLRLGACDAADDAQARRTVMTAAVDVCEAYYFRKMRRHPGAKALWEALDTPRRMMRCFPYCAFRSAAAPPSACAMAAAFPWRIPRRRCASARRGPSG